MRPGLPPVDRRRADAGLGLPPDRARRPVVPVRERDRRREGRPVQLPRHRAVPDVRGPRARRSPYGNRREPGESRRFTSRDPFLDLEELLERYRAVPSRGLPRFAGGAVGYAAYDAVRYTEHLPNAPPDDRGLPDLSFAFYDRMVLFDHIRKTILVVAQAHLGTGQRPQGSLRAGVRPGRRAGRPAGRARARSWASATSTPTRRSRSSPGRTSRGRSTRRSSGTARSTSRPATSSRSFPASGSRSRPRPSRSTSTGCCGSSIPSPFLFYLPFGDFALIGSSPEILVRVEDGMVTIRPLAGTRRRGSDEAEDRALAEELLADPKERAEHIMLVDLGRNDVGRVADYQTVQLTDVMKVERYSHVMHITSNVTGRLRAGKTAFDALRAGLPAGTVSGAPKVRAMQIIDEVEPQKRGPYAGAVGYIDFTGNMDTCIALRTLVLQGKTAYVQAGGGVVYDSDPGCRVRGDRQQGAGAAQGDRDRRVPAHPLAAWAAAS